MARCRRLNKRHLAGAGRRGELKEMHGIHADLSSIGTDLLGAGERVPVGSCCMAQIGRGGRRQRCLEAARIVVQGGRFHRDVLQARPVEVRLY